MLLRAEAAPTDPSFLPLVACRVDSLQLPPRGHLGEPSQLGQPRPEPKDLAMGPELPPVSSVPEPGCCECGCCHAGRLLFKSTYSLCDVGKVLAHFSDWEFTTSLGGPFQGGTALFVRKRLAFLTYPSVPRSALLRGSPALPLQRLPQACITVTCHLPQLPSETHASLPCPFPGGSQQQGRSMSSSTSSPGVWPHRLRAHQLFCCPRPHLTH